MSRDEVVTASVHITESPCFKVLLLIYTAAPNMAILSLIPALLLINRYFRFLPPFSLPLRQEQGVKMKC